MTPDAGPDRSVDTVCDRAAATGMMPPLDLVTYGTAGTARVVSAASKPSRYRRTFGCT